MAEGAVSMDGLTGHAALEAVETFTYTSESPEPEGQQQTPFGPETNGLETR